MYADNFRVLQEISDDAFGPGTVLIKPAEVKSRLEGLDCGMTGNEVVVFGRYWGQELPLPRPPGVKSGESRKYYVDWILAKIDAKGELKHLTAVEVQTIDTTGNYSSQAQAFFAGQRFTDDKGRTPGFSNAGLNWENVNSCSARAQSSKW